MLKTWDGVYYFYRPEPGGGYLRLRIYEDLSSVEYTEQRLTYVVVIVTRLWGYPGGDANIDLYVEDIATQLYNLQLSLQHIRQQEHPQIDTFYYIQHLPTSPTLLNEETFRRVRMEMNTEGRFVNPKYAALEREDVQLKVRDPLY